MNNKRKLIAILTIISIILVIAITLLTIKLIIIRKNKQDVVTVNENIVIENEIDNSNEINNEAQTNNEIENSVNEEIIDQNTIHDTNDSTPVVDTDQEIDEQTIEKQESDREKAISIAKKDWGEDNTVYFSYEGNNNGKYRVCVRKADTTYAIRYYIINVNNGTFEIEE